MSYKVKNVFLVGLFLVSMPIFASTTTTERNIHECVLNTAGRVEVSVSHDENLWILKGQDILESGNTRLSAKARLKTRCLELPRGETMRFRNTDFPKTRLTERSEVILNNIHVCEALLSEVKCEIGVVREIKKNQ